MEEGHWRCDLIGQTEEASGKPQVVRAVLQVQRHEPCSKKPTITSAQQAFQALQTQGQNTSLLPALSFNCPTTSSC